MSYVKGEENDIKFRGRQYLEAGGLRKSTWICGMQLYLEGQLALSKSQTCKREREFQVKKQARAQEERWDEFWCAQKC